MKKKKITLSRRRIRPPVANNLRPANAPDFLVTAGRARVIFEKEGKLFTSNFPPKAKEPILELDCKSHAVSMSLNYCTGVIVENTAAKPGQPKALIFHLPPVQRAQDYRGPFTYADKVVPALLKAMPSISRVELIGGHGKGKCAEVLRIERDLLKNGIRPIIKKENVGGRDPKRWVELRPQKGKQTVFDYSQKYVLSMKEVFTQKGLAKGFSGQKLRQFVSENLTNARQTISSIRKAGDKPFFK